MPKLNLTRERPTQAEIRKLCENPIILQAVRSGHLWWAKILCPKCGRQVEECSFDELAETPVFGDLPSWGAMFLNARYVRCITCDYEDATASLEDLFGDIRAGVKDLLKMKYSIQYRVVPKSEIERLQKEKTTAAKL